jgi:hypothetical protein
LQNFDRIACSISKKHNSEKTCSAPRHPSTLGSQAPRSPPGDWAMRGARVDTNFAIF